jgi:hypothetical protein
MPTHGPNGGAADSLDEAKAAFRAAWERPLSEGGAGMFGLSLSAHTRAEFAELWNISRTSTLLRLHVCGAHHLAPFCSFIFEVLSEIRSRNSERHGAKLRKSGLDLRSFRSAPISLLSLSKIS